MVKTIKSIKPIKPIKPLLITENDNIPCDSCHGRIDSFTGVYRFLSNFYLSNVVHYVFNYPSVECAYQSAKSYDFLHKQNCFAGFYCTNLDQAEYCSRWAKKAGRMIPTLPKLSSSISALRTDWDDVKLSIMKDLLEQKFTAQHSLTKFDNQLADMLLSTGQSELIEGNWWGDTYWGVCRGVGENHLGKLLMEIRSKLRIIYGYKVN